MEIKILEDKKKRLVFEIIGEDHTLCNALRDELWNDKTVTIAVYNISHPIIGIPKFIIEADDPKEALKGAISRLKKKNNELLKSLK
ncbi:MAG: DNA-directed RNA polymerase subunit L [Candidatus Woesearchaeota archaeon]|jgi:DNA-directed RNA polymerase subunit L|nr:DNA-directed RNA polymerase subunit L [Candidatus Woesearchaeota archaeon]